MQDLGLFYYFVACFLCGMIAVLTAPIPAIIDPCLDPEVDKPYERDGCAWEPITHPEHQCVVNFQCRPDRQMELQESSPGCPLILEPIHEVISGVKCDYEPQYDEEGCLTWWSCDELRIIKDPYKQYYIEPYTRDKRVYPFFPPGWKGGYGIRYYPEEYRYLVE